jgi:hypothetical protein
MHRCFSQKSPTFSTKNSHCKTYIWWGGGAGRGSCSAAPSRSHRDRGRGGAPPWCDPRAPPLRRCVGTWTCEWRRMERYPSTPHTSLPIPPVPFLAGDSSGVDSSGTQGSNVALQRRRRTRRGTGVVELYLSWAGGGSVCLASGGGVHGWAAAEAHRGGALVSAMGNGETD